VNVVVFESVIKHEYFLVLYGVILYFTVLYSIDTSRLGKRFTWKNFKAQYKDEFILAMMFAPLMVAFDDEMLGWYNNVFEKDIEFGKWFYLMAGPLVTLIVKAVKKFRGKHEPT
jgi:hypothetical protein